MNTDRKNPCPVCGKNLGVGTGPLKVKCTKCKAVVLIAPEKIVIIEEPNFQMYATCFSLGLTNYPYESLKNLEISIHS